MTFELLTLLHEAPKGLRVLDALRGDGLKVEIDYRWLDGNGYRPVRVEVINWPPGPTKADRSICIGPARSSESYLNARAILQAAHEHHQQHSEWGRQQRERREDPR